MDVNHAHKVIFIGKMPQNVLVFYTKRDCPLCEKAEFALERIRARHRDLSLKIEKRDIASDPRWFETYRYRVPVLELHGEVLAEGRVEEGALKRRLREVLSA